jgi:hypothetical protein
LTVCNRNPIQERLEVADGATTWQICVGADSETRSRKWSADV